jgi:hypothetical protein
MAASRRRKVLERSLELLVLLEPQCQLRLDIGAHVANQLAHFLDEMRVVRLANLHLGDAVTPG